MAFGCPEAIRQTALDASRQRQEYFGSAAFLWRKCGVNRSDGNRHVTFPIHPFRLYSCPCPVFDHRGFGRFPDRFAVVPEIDTQSTGLSALLGPDIMLDGRGTGTDGGLDQH
jgi:hypothetical protein